MRAGGEYAIVSLRVVYEATKRVSRWQRVYSDILYRDAGQ